MLIMLYVANLFVVAGAVLDIANLVVDDVHILALSNQIVIVDVNHVISC
jgi:hypothetical protein